MLIIFMVYYLYDVIKERKDEFRFLEYIIGWDILSYVVYKSVYYFSFFYNLIIRVNFNCYFFFYLKYR